MEILYPAKSFLGAKRGILVTLKAQFVESEEKHIFKVNRYLFMILVYNYILVAQGTI